jgi:hypothetical protein
MFLAGMGMGMGGLENDDAIGERLALSVAVSFNK